MDGLEMYARLTGLDRSPGDLRLSLRVGDERLGIGGLDEALAADLDRRWGGFLDRADDGPHACEVRVYAGGPEPWLELPRAEEAYRFEALNDVEQRLVASYHFALTRQPGPLWRVALTEQTREPRQRCLDNVLRYVVAHRAMERGGFAMHAAGVLRDGRAYLFAGPSRAGKSTVVRHSAPAISLGDDFALVLPDGGGWAAPALPFDNSERIEGTPPAGLFPVAGIWKLHQSERVRVEQPPRRVAVASLLGCTAFPWTMPDQAGRLLEQVERFVAAGGFRHLHFADDPGFWTHLV